MSCFDLRFVDLYLEGEVEAGERAEFEAHLETCPACRRVLEERRVLLAAFSSLPAVEVPSDFACAVMDRLPAHRRFAVGWVAAAGSAAASLLIGLLGFYLFTGQSLAEVLTSAGRSVMETVGLAVPVLAKMARLGGLILRAIPAGASAVLKGLGVASRFLSPAVLCLLLAGGCVLSFFFIVGMKKILYVGEKP